VKEGGVSNGDARVGDGCRKYVDGDASGDNNNKSVVIMG